MPSLKKSQIYRRAALDAELEKDLKPAIEIRAALLAMGSYADLSNADRALWHRYSVFVETFGHPLVFQFDDFSKTELYCQKLGLPAPVRPLMTDRNKRRGIQF